MPNWSSVLMKIVGPGKDIRNLRDRIKRLENRKTPRLPNGFGKLWWGNIVDSLGKNWKEIPCRGYICYWDWSPGGGVLTLDSDFAWGLPFEILDLIEDFYDKRVKVYYLEEEPGMGIYETNDEEGRYFQERYKIDGEVEPWPEYFSTIEETAERLSSFVEFSVDPTEKGIDDAITRWELEANEDEDRWLSFNKFEVIRRG